MQNIKNALLAKEFIDKLANGINPIDGTEIPEDNILNNARIVRGLFFVSEVLRDEISSSYPPEQEYKPLPAIPVFTEEMREQLKPYEAGSFGTSITELINSQIPDGFVKLKKTTLNRWLLREGFLEKREAENGRGWKKFPTAAGEELGLSNQECFGSHGRYLALLFSPEAQQFIFDNVEALFSAQTMPRKPARAFQPWNEEEIERLKTLVAEGKKPSEIAKELERSRTAVRSRLALLGLLE